MSVLLASNLDRRGIVATFAYLLIWAAYMYFVCLLCLTLNAGEVFTWHPITMATGVLFMGHGAISYRSNPDMPKHDQRIRHGLAMYTGTFAFLMGFVLIIIHKHDIKHSTSPSSLHSWFGVLTLAFIGVQCLGGMLKYKLLPWRPRVMVVHGILGKLIFPSSVITLCLGAAEFHPALDDGSTNPLWKPIPGMILHGLATSAVLLMWFVIDPSETRSRRSLSTTERGFMDRLAEPLSP